MTKFWHLRGRDLHQHDGTLVAKDLPLEVTMHINQLLEKLSVQSTKIRNYRATTRHLQKCLLASQTSATRNASDYNRVLHENYKLRRELNGFKYGGNEINKITSEWRYERLYEAALKDLEDLQKEMKNG